MRTLLATLACVGWACRSGPTGVGPTPPMSTQRLEGVAVTLTAAPLAVAPGDTVRFAVTATNHSGARVQLGEACGPNMDVVVTGGGAAVSVLWEAVGPDGAFTCELRLDYHFAGPGETRTQTLAWRAPARRGTYTAVAGLRRRDGLGNVSAPLTVTVR